MEASTIQNPNEYDGTSYMTALNTALAGIGDMWNAGADVRNISDTVEEAIQNVQPGARVKCLITVEPGGDEDPSIDIVVDAEPGT